MISFTVDQPRYNHNCHEHSAENTLRGDKDVSVRPERDSMGEQYSIEVK